MFAAAGTLGSWLPVTTPARLGIILTGALVLGVAEIRRLSRGDPHSIGPRRQTPKEIGNTAFGVFLWGVDTGTVVTTVRATILPLLTLLLVASGFGIGWLTGVAYGCGFTLAIAFAISERGRRLRRSWNRSRHYRAIPAMRRSVRCGALLLAFGIVLTLVGFTS